MEGKMALHTGSLPAASFLRGAFVAVDLCGGSFLPSHPSFALNCYENTTQHVEAKEGLDCFVVHLFVCHSNPEEAVSQLVEPILMSVLSSLKLELEEDELLMFVSTKIRVFG